MLVKRFLLCLLLSASVSAFADDPNSSPIDNPKELNKPTVGSRQSGSEQVFGNPPITGTKGQTYTHEATTTPNKSTVGSRQSGSEQVFGNPPITGTKGQTYTRETTTIPNKSTVGSRQSGSEQVFGNPGSTKPD